MSGLRDHEAFDRRSAVCVGPSTSDPAGLETGTAGDGGATAVLPETLWAIQRSPMGIVQVAAVRGYPPDQLVEALALQQAGLDVDGRILLATKES
jgi:hypothetical protein